MKKTQKLVALFLCLVLAIGLLPLVGAPAAALTDGDWEFDYSGLDATLTKYNGTAANISIPLTIGGGYTVRILGSKLFNGKDIESVSIPSTVTTFKDAVFRDCTKLKSVTLAEGLKVIDEFSFFGCTSLTSITLPSTVTEIGDYAFDGTSLTSIVIPQGVKTVGYYTFGNCGDLSSVTIPSSVTTIGMSAFYGCSSLSSLTLPEGVKTISSNAFKYCGNLNYITLPASLTTVGNSAFDTVNNLRKVYYNGYDKSNISVSSNNDPLNNAEWVYYAPTLEEPVVTSSSVQLSWSAVTSATAYKVYRRANSTGSWSSWTPVKTLTTESWTDTAVSVGNLYQYRVRACVGGTYRGYSNIVTVTIPVPAGAATLSGTALVGKNSLSWTVVSGASQYKVYRRVNSGSGWDSWMPVKTLPGTAWSDTGVTAGGQYQYRVRACVGGTWGPYSNIVTLTGKAAPPAATLSGDALPGRNSLSWTSVPGASTYRVYRRVNSGSGWDSWVPVKNLPGTVWPDSEVTEGFQYQYRVRASVDGEYGPYSNIVTLTALDAGAAATLSGSAVSGSNNLSWTTVSGATTYRMYRRVNSGSGWSTWTPVRNQSGTTWSDAPVEGGTQYQYRVRACVDGVYGPYSNIVTLTAVAGSTIYGEAMLHENVLAWTYVPGATAYKVYRRVNSGSGWDSWTPARTQTGTTWSDTAVTEGCTYQYRVRACLDGVYGGYSNIVSLLSPIDDYLNVAIPRSLEPLDTNVIVAADITWLAVADYAQQYRFWVFDYYGIIIDSGFITDDFFTPGTITEGGPYTAWVFIEGPSGDISLLKSTTPVFVFEA